MREVHWLALEENVQQLRVRVSTDVKIARNALDHEVPAQMGQGARRSQGERRGRQSYGERPGERPPPPCPAVARHSPVDIAALSDLLAGIPDVNGERSAVCAPLDLAILVKAQLWCSKGGVTNNVMVAIQWIRKR